MLRVDQFVGSFVVKTGKSDVIVRFDAHRVFPLRRPTQMRQRRFALILLFVFKMARQIVEIEIETVRKNGQKEEQEKLEQLRLF